MASPLEREVNTEPKYGNHNDESYQRRGTSPGTAATASQREIGPNKKCCGIGTDTPRGRAMQARQIADAAKSTNEHTRKWATHHLKVGGLAAGSTRSWRIQMHDILEETMNHNHQTASAAWHKSPAMLGLLAILGVAGAFFLVSHWEHVAPLWPWLAVLAMPMLHVFMRGGHGGHADQGGGCCGGHGNHVSLESKSSTWAKVTDAVAATAARRRPRKPSSNPPVSQITEPTRIG